MTKDQNISPEDILADIRAGATDEIIMSQYHLTEGDLLGLFNDLVSAGLITEEELPGRASAKAKEPRQAMIERRGPSTVTDMVTVHQPAEGPARGLLELPAPQRIHYTIESIEPEFPHNVWSLRSYKNPFRIVILIIVLLNAYGLSQTYFLDVKEIEKQVVETRENRGPIKRAFIWVKELWQKEPPELEDKKNLEAEITSQKRWAWGWFLASLGLLWIGFDWDRAFAWLSSAALGSVMVLYLLSPIDFIPDAIPVMGTLDEVGVVGGAVLLIAGILKRYHDQRAAILNLQRLAPEHPERLADAALQIHGYRLAKREPPREYPAEASSRQ